MKTTLDRVTINFGPSELALIDRLRTLGGERGLNRLIKQILREWLEAQTS